MKKKYRLRFLLTFMTFVALVALVSLRENFSRNQVDEAEKVTQQNAGELLIEAENLTKAVVQAKEENKSLADVMPASKLRKIEEQLKTIDPEYLKGQILEENQTIARYVRLKNKVVKTPEEEQEYAELLSDVAAMDGFLDQMVLDPSMQYSRKEEIKRLLLVDLYADALRWKQNPARAQVEEKVKGLLLNPDLFDSNVAPRLRQSTYVDRLELFRVLAEQDRSTATKIRELVRPSQFRQYMDEILQNLDKQGV